MNPNTKANDGYRFIDKDPSIDFCLAEMRKRGLDEMEMARRAYLSVRTIKSWDSGKVKKPHHMSLVLFLNGLGLEYRVGNIGAGSRATTAAIPTMDDFIKSFVETKLEEMRAAANMDEQVASMKNLPAPEPKKLAKRKSA